MNALNSYWRPLCAAAIVLAFSWTNLSQAADKKDTRKGKDDKVIVIQLDASKVSPDVLKKLLGASKGTDKDDDRRPVKKGDDKKSATKKDGGKKPNLVQVDLNKLSPDLAKRLSAELSKGPGKAKKDDDDDDDKKGSKSKAKKDDDDDKKRSKSKSKKDDDDDVRKRGTKKDD